ncbi:hypothetical protein BRD03_10480 [Halobacteriales archaeon QS_9_68_17]|nr:MAG: hypothetical protein BRD03_10480 [Halobacteriales archaeon QS_9_68_17]
MCTTPPREARAERSEPWYLLASFRDGETRARILRARDERPRSATQPADGDHAGRHRHEENDGPIVGRDEVSQSV